MFRISPMIHETCLAALVAAILPLTAALASPEKVAGLSGVCRDALPLSLSESTDGYAAFGRPALYAFEVTRPSIVVIEAHGPAGSVPETSPEVRFRDWDCRPDAVSARTESTGMRGRDVQRIDVPGVYFVEVVADDLAERRFRLDAWQVEDVGPVTPDRSGGSTGEDDVPPPPVDEWDEIGMSPRPVAGPILRFHAWCPLAERPELLRTYTCARQLHLGHSGRFRVRRLLDESSEMVGVELTEPGRLTADGGWVAVFDARGRLAVELDAGASVRLRAGGYFLRWSDKEALILDVDLE